MIQRCGEHFSTKLRSSTDNVSVKLLYFDQKIRNLEEQI